MENLIPYLVPAVIVVIVVLLLLLGYEIGRAHV